MDRDSGLARDGEPSSNVDPRAQARFRKTAGLRVVANHIRERTADVDTNGQSGQRDLP
jgi:hypothetical protein